jgi:hypothetical protein
MRSQISCRSMRINAGWVPAVPERTIFMPKELANA